MCVFLYEIFWKKYKNKDLWLRLKTNKKNIYIILQKL